jgi:hypothetical protein
MIMQAYLQDRSNPPAVCEIVGNLATLRFSHGEDTRETKRPPRPPQVDGREGKRLRVK